jgi:hypothetical protein
MDWPFLTAEYVELADEVLRLRAEVRQLRARIAELDPPRAKKKKRGRPLKDEVGAKHGGDLARAGRLQTHVNLGTGEITTVPRVRNLKTGEIMISPLLRKRR